MMKCLHRPRRLLVILAICSVAGSLAGCDTLNDSLAGDRIDYTKVSAAPPLSVPPNLSQPELASDFVAPARNTDLLASPALDTRPSRTQPAGTNKPTATATSAATAMNGPLDISVTQDAQRSWLVLRGNISLKKLWAQLETFWQNNGFTLATDSPATGVLETDWAQNRANIANGWVRNSVVGQLLSPLYSSGTRDRFRTVVERNANGTIDIFITHSRMKEVLTGRDKESSRWIAQPRDRQLETAFLQRLLQNFGLTAQEAQQRIAQAKTISRGTLSSSDGAVWFSLHEPFENAWQQVGAALDRTDYAVIGSDKNRGIYTVSHRDTSQDNPPGLLSRLFRRSNNAQALKPVVSAQQYNVTLRVASPPATPGRLLTAPDYAREQDRIRTQYMKQPYIYIEVIDPNGLPDTSSEAHRIITQLYQALD